MILKLCNPGGVEMFVTADNIQRYPTENGHVCVIAYMGGKETGRWLIGDGAEVGYERAYVMDAGKTVDSIRSRSAGITGPNPIPQSDDITRA